METEKQGEKKIREVRKTNKQAKNVRKRRGTQHRGIREGGGESQRTSSKVAGRRGRSRTTASLDRSFTFFLWEGLSDNNDF